MSDLLQSEMITAESPQSTPRRAPRPAPTERPLVLMGFADALAAVESAWSLQAAGFRVAAFGRAGRRVPLRRVPGVELFEIAAPEEDVAATVATLHALIDELRPAALMPLDDHSVWVSTRLNRPETVIAGPVGAAAQCALDKSLQIHAAATAGLPVLPTRVLSNPLDAAPITTPVILKAACPVVERDGALVRPTAVVCADDTELRAAGARPWHGPVLVQPLVSGEGEGLFGHVGEDGVVGWSAHRRVRMMNPQGSGSSACRSHPVDPALLGAAERFLAAIGWRGLFMLEFLRDADGTPWFMEINGRAWGSMALARRRGLEYPAWAVNAALDPAFAPPVPSLLPDVVCRNIGMELVHLMFVARGPRSEAADGWPTLGNAIRDVFRRHPNGHWYNWNPAQPQVFLSDTVTTVGSYIRKLVRSRP